MDALTGQLTSLVEAVPAWAVYLIAFGIVFLETAVVLVGLVAPSEAVLIAAGVMAAVGTPHIWVLVVGCGVAAVAGDSTGYLVGRGLGPRLSASKLGRWLTRKAIRSRHKAPDGHRAPSASDAIIAVAGARWVGFVRSVSPLIAGGRHMPYRRFVLASALGGISWTATVLMVSYIVGETLGAEVALIVAISVGALALGLLVFRRWRANRHTSTASSIGSP